MIEELKDRQYAFPSTFKSLIEGEHIHCFGMQLRDYFAAKAMQGLLASSRSPHASNPAADVTDALIADLSYKIADAMIEQRERNYD